MFAGALTTYTSFRWHQTCYFRKRATSAAAELGGEIHNVLRNRARTQVLPQARKLHVYGSGTFGAFWLLEAASEVPGVDPRLSEPQRRGLAVVASKEKEILRNGRKSLRHREPPQRQLTCPYSALFSKMHNIQMRLTKDTEAYSEGAPSRGALKVPMTIHMGLDYI